MGVLRKGRQLEIKQRDSPFFDISNLEEKSIYENDISDPCPA